ALVRLIPWRVPSGWGPAAFAPAGGRSGRWGPRERPSRGPGRRPVKMVQRAQERGTFLRHVLWMAGCGLVVWEPVRHHRDRLLQLSRLLPVVDPGIRVEPRPGDGGLLPQPTGRRAPVRDLGRSPDRPVRHAPRAPRRLGLRGPGVRRVFDDAVTGGLL